MKRRSAPTVHSTANTETQKHQSSSRSRDKDSAVAQQQPGGLRQRVILEENVSGIRGLEDAHLLVNDVCGLRGGNQVSPLIGGKAVFSEMLEVIRRATKRVHLETFILADGSVAERFASVLMERARNGVEVRLMCDGIGSVLLSGSYVNRLQAAGVQVCFYNSLRRFRHWRTWDLRNHRKILIVDEHIGFVGGINIDDRWLSRQEGGDGWFDIHARVVGPVAVDLDALFCETWRSETGDQIFATLEDQGTRGVGQRAAVVGSRRLRNRLAIRRMYLHAIRHAKKSVFIANAYFIPDRGVSRALRNAAERGVQVDIMTSENSDSWLAQRAGEATFSGLLRSGVRIHLWTPSVMHAKVAVVDQTWVVIGTYNLDYLSLLRNLEAIVEVLDPALGTTLGQVLLDTTRQCQLLQLENWRRRSRPRKLAAKFAYSLRRFL